MHLIYTEVHNLYFDCTILGHRLSWSFISSFLSPSQAAGEGRAPPGQVQGCPSQKIIISFLKHLYCDAHLDQSLDLSLPLVRLQQHLAAHRPSRNLRMVFHMWHWIFVTCNTLNICHMWILISITCEEYLTHAMHICHTWHCIFVTCHIEYLSQMRLNICHLIACNSRQFPPLLILPRLLKTSRLKPKIVFPQVLHFKLKTNEYIPQVLMQPVGYISCNNW